LKMNTVLELLKITIKYNIQLPYHGKKKPIAAKKFKISFMF